MAVDTAAKRFSMMGLDRIWMPVMVQPSGTVPRQSFLAKYVGILFSAPIVGTGDIAYLILARRRRMQYPVDG